MSLNSMYGWPQQAEDPFLMDEEMRKYLMSQYSPQLVNDDYNPQPVNASYSPSLAFNDGASARSHIQMREAGVGPYEGLPAPSKPAPTPYRVDDRQKEFDAKPYRHPMTGEPMSIADYQALMKALKKQSAPTPRK